LTRRSIASPLYQPNRAKENSEAARKQNDECKNIACHFSNLMTVTISLVDFKDKGRAQYVSRDFSQNAGRDNAARGEHEFWPHPRQ
jgi:hypothetical protein